MKQDNISNTVRYGLGGHSRPKHETNSQSENNIYKSSMNTVLFVNATVGFSENIFLV